MYTGMQNAPEKRGATSGELGNLGGKFCISLIGRVSKGPLNGFKEYYRRCLFMVLEWVRFTQEHTSLAIDHGFIGVHTSKLQCQQQIPAKQKRDFTFRYVGIHFL